jgi:hypothetical protein
LVDIYVPNEVVGGLNPGLLPYVPSMGRVHQLVKRPCERVVRNVPNRTLFQVRLERHVLVAGHGV